MGLVQSMLGRGQSRCNYIDASGLWEGSRGKTMDLVVQRLLRLLVEKAGISQDWLIDVICDIA